MDDATRAVLSERFWAKVDRRGPDECWNWLGAHRGVYNHDRRPILSAIANNRKQLLAYRVSWELNVGPIPDGLLVCHHCDNPSCVNPAHLFVGTQLDNVRDMWAKGRGSKPPHPLKFSDDVIREIRRAHAAGESQKSISRRLGLPGGYACRVVNRKLRGEVT